jgi:hypothetical protein
MVTLINYGGQKMGMAMKLDPENFEEYSKDEDDGEVNDYSSAKFTKTGRTETISGYTCHEYKMEHSEQDDDYDYYYWVAPDADIDVMKSMSDMMSSNKQMSKNYQMPTNYPEGSMIRMVTEKKKNDEKTVMTIKEVNRNQPETFSTVGYRMMSMGGN